MQSSSRINVAVDYLPGALGSGVSKIGRIGSIGGATGFCGGGAATSSVVVVTTGALARPLVGAALMSTVGVSGTGAPLRSCKVTLVGAARRRDFNRGLLGAGHDHVAVASHFGNPLAFGFFAGGNDDPSVRALGFLRLRIKEVSGFAVAIDFREIAHVVQGESVVGLKLIGLLEVVARGGAFITIDSGDATQVQAGDLRTDVLFLGHLLLNFFRVGGGNFVDGLTSPARMNANDDRLMRAGVGSLIVKRQSLLKFAFFFLGVAEVIQRERIFRVQSERFLQRDVGFGCAIFLQHARWRTRSDG